MKKYHLIGIGGISMSGIASYLLHKGYRVSGSDVKDNHLLENLRKEEVEIYIGHYASNLNDVDFVVVSSAIPEDNVELTYARDQGIPILKRAELIAQFMDKKKGIAISGTHGKTTTTSMLSMILNKAETSPTVMLGGELSNIGGNLQIGTGEYFLAEADESDGSLLYFNPLLVIVTNIELDHLDYYDSQVKLLNTFQKFINNIPENGQAVLCAEDENIQKLIAYGDERIMTYGFTKGNIRARDIKLLPFGSYFTVEYNNNKLGTINLRIPGKHNILNALATIGASMYLGLSFTDIQKALKSYSGVKRRFEKKGLIGDILVVDDYAHHPTEIKAVLQATQKTGYERIIAVFQPHRYTRTKHLLKEFSKAFDLADHLIITDIYSAGEKPIKGINSKKLFDKTAKNSSDIKIDYIKKLADVTQYLQQIIKPKDLILTIGAGDVYKVGEMLIKNMKKQREMA